MEDTKFVLIVCPDCGRVKKLGEYIYLTKRQRKKLVKRDYDIIFSPCGCLKQYWCMKKGKAIKHQKANKKCIGINLEKRGRECPYLLVR